MAANVEVAILGVFDHLTNAFSRSYVVVLLIYSVSQCHYPTTYPSLELAVPHKHEISWIWLEGSPQHHLDEYIHRTSKHTLY
jgi:hypothetical protein